MSLRARLVTFFTITIALTVFLVAALVSSYTTCSYGRINDDRTEALEKELARAQAGDLAAKGSPVVAKVERASLARALAAAVAERGATALVGAVEDGRAHLCFARPRGAPGPGMNDVLKAALAVLGGKGGGSPDFAQGSGDPARLDEALAAARAQASTQ